MSTPVTPLKGSLESPRDMSPPPLKESPREPKRDHEKKMKKEKKDTHRLSRELGELPQKLSSDDEAGDEVIQYVTKEKLERFFRNFKDMPESEDLLLVKSCSLEKEILISGDLFVTRNFFCFSGRFFGKKYQSVVYVRNVVRIEKKKFGLFQNGIKIVAKNDAKMYLLGFSKRDAVFNFINIVWNTTMDPVFQKAHKMVINKQESKYFICEGILEETIESESTGLSTQEKEKRLSADLSSSASGSTVYEDSPSSFIEPSKESLSEPSSSKSEGLISSTPSTPHPPEIAVPFSDNPWIFVSGHEGEEEREREREREKDGVLAKPEKVYRSRLSMDFKTAASLPDTESNAATIDRHTVIAMAREKAKKREDKEDRLVDRPIEKTTDAFFTQPLVLTDIFQLESQEIFNTIFGKDSSFKFTTRSDVINGSWENKDGKQTREVLYSQTTKLNSKDKDRYLLCKYREVQKIEKTEGGYYFIDAETLTSETDLFDGISFLITYTVTPMADSNKMSRLTISFQIKHQRQNSKEIIDAMQEISEGSFKEILAHLSKESTSKIEQANNEKKAQEAAAQPPVVQPPPPNKPAPLGDVNKIYIAVGVVVLLLAIFWMWAPFSSVSVSEEEKWLTALKNSQSKISYDSSEVLKLHDEYKKLLLKDTQKVETLSQEIFAIIGKLKKVKTH